MNIIPKLSIKDNINTIDNNSLVHATNINLNDDGLLQTDYNIKENEIINNTLKSYFNESEYEIKYCLECSEELIIFVLENGNSTLTGFRYNEIYNECIFIFDNYLYYGGKLTSTFTYNKNDLIIAISEYNIGNDILVPLRTLNLKSFEYSKTDKYREYINNEIKFSEIKPAVDIPQVSYEFNDGYFYKGWYNIFIRYKINDYDYTQWYGIGLPFVLHDIENFNIIKSCYNKTDNGYDIFEIYDNFNTNDEISYNTVKLNFTNLDNNYKYFQIGAIIFNKSSSKAIKTFDIKIDNSYLVFDKNIFENYYINELLIKHFNYYDVKSLTSNKNYLLISNFKETTNENNINTENINFKLKIDYSDFRNIYTNNTETVYNNTFTKNNNTITSIGEKGIIKFKDYCQQISALKELANANDSDDFTIKYNNSNNSITHKFGDLYISLNKSNTYEYGRYLLYDKDGKQIPFYYSNVTSGTELEYIQAGNYKVNLSGLGSLLYNFILSYEIIKPENRLDNKQLSNKYINKNTLLPGEVYNFYIHYVDKYGNYTNGYKILNNIKTNIKENNTYIKELILLNGEKINVNELVPLYVIINDGISYPIKYKVLVKAYSKCIDEDSFIKDDNGYFIYTVNNNLYNNYFDLNTNNRKTNLSEDNEQEIINLIKNKYYYNENDIWANIIENIIFNEINDINPMDKIEFLPYINSKNEILFRVPIFPLNREINNIIKLNLIKLFVNNIIIPEEYNGWFLSYEKLEERKKLTGFCEFNDDNKKVIVYSDEFNILDEININVDKIRFIFYNNVSNTSVSYLWNGNNLINNYEERNINDLNLIIADSKDNIGQGTKLIIDLKETIPNIPENNKVFCELYSSNRNIYINNTKELYKCTNIYYENINNEYTSLNVFSGLISSNTAIIYNKNGVILDNGIIKFYNQSSDKNYINFYQFFSYSSYYKELKEYNNEPNINVIPVYNGFLNTSNVLPKDSIDLWKNNYNILPFIELFTDKKENENNISFTNIIRKSNIILDESNENKWRIFNTDAYKNLSENKGEIIKLINTGNNILIHTKHSLFILDGSDTIKSSDDGKIQLSSVDIWDINFKELTPSILGYGGLDKAEHSIAGNFGYIWYNDNKIFMISGNNSFKLLSDDISSFISKNSNFTLNNLFEDVVNSRIIFNFDDTCLSFSYKSNTFISFLTYLNDSKIYNTKTKTYIIYKDTNKCFNYDFNNSIYINNINSSISIIYNNKADSLKLLESVIYSLHKKIKFNYNDILLDFIKEPNYYAGDYLNIISESCNTGNISIDINKNNVNNINNDGPYWELGSWKFNNIRNGDGIILDDKNNSYVYGKFFIFTLTLCNNDIYQITSVDFNVSNF